MNVDLQAQAQAMANEVFDELGVKYAPLTPQHERHDILRYHMYAHNFRYSGVFCRIVVTIYAEKPLELLFCATGHNPIDGYDETHAADNAKDLLFGIWETIGRAKDVKRQQYHEMQRHHERQQHHERQHRLYSDLTMGGTGQDLPVIGGTGPFSK